MYRYLIICRVPIFDKIIIVMRAEFSISLVPACNMTNRVKARNPNSIVVRDVPSGVLLQGGHLQPIRFTIFVNCVKACLLNE